MSKNVLWQTTVDCPHCCLPQSLSDITSHVALCSSRPSKFVKNILVPSSLEDGSATAGYQTKPRMFSGTVSMILRATTTSQWILCYVSRLQDGRAGRPLCARCVCLNEQQLTWTSKILPLSLQVTFWRNAMNVMPFKLKGKTRCHDVAVFSI